MEAKGIFYLFLGIGYLVYSMMKKAKEKSGKPNATPLPKKQSTFDEAIEEYKTNQQEAKNVKSLTQSGKTIKPKSIFVQEKVNPIFEEGKSSYKVFEELTYAEGGSQLEAIESMPIKEVEPVYFNFDIRSGIINSIILERKF